MSELQIFNCEQGSPEWYACRLGIPTASRFATVMAKGKGGGESKTRTDYMYDLVGEKLTQTQAEGFSNSHMERGHEMEPDARRLYAMVRDVEPVQIGFLRRGDVGASPDSLVGDNGLLEIKTKLPRLQLQAVFANRLPPEHRAQVQGQLWVSGREWLDFVSYWPGLKPLIVRVERDEPYIAEIAIAVSDFLCELNDLMNQYEAIAA
jgi:hypothetical protein